LRLNVLAQESLKPDGANEANTLRVLFGRSWQTKFCRQLADLLIKRERAGVQVNVIYDSVGSILTPRSLFDKMHEAGINVLEFNPVNPAETRRRYMLDHRDHRKILVV